MRLYNGTTERGNPMNNETLMLLAVTIFVIVMSLYSVMQVLSFIQFKNFLKAFRAEKTKNEETS